MRTIDQVLDTAKTVQKVPSDYKLGLTLGIGPNALSNYRNGRSFPDEKACVKLAQAMGEDPAILMVEMQAQRSKDADARALWENLAKRLQAGFASAEILVLVAILSIATPALFTGFFGFFAPNVCILCLIAAVRLMVKITGLLVRNVKLCKGAGNVPCNPHSTALRPA